MHLATLPPSVSLYTDLLAVCGGGNKEIRPAERRLAGLQTYIKVHALGRVRLRPRAVNFNHVSLIIKKVVSLHSLFEGVITL